MKMQQFFRLTIFLMLIGGAFTHTAFAQIRHEVFLPNTDHELHVYRIFGDIPGKTVMIIGGIQGDEPGSYLTADLYADINLKKGNLIVVPRANFYSILLNRREGLTGDMNRKFDTEEKRKNNFEEEVVTVLKHLIAESDCLLNLHEGSGYYNPVWVSAIENPKRYGQSIIFDAKTYKVPGENRTIHLGDIARKVVDKVNPQIDNKRHRFRVSDHDTLSSKSIHKEQRKSATYYALTTAHIPAFGVETSKSIKSLKTKIRLHKLVINTMMEEFGIVLDPPGFIVSPPKLDYLLVTINNGHPLALKHGTELELAYGDDFVVTDIIANYERGLVADIAGIGTTNDTNRQFRFSEKTRIIVRKDAQECGWVDLKLGKPELARVKEQKRLISEDELQVETLMIDENGKLRNVANKGTLQVKKGARLTMQGVRTNIARLDKDVIVNFKGFAPPKSVNDGNDLLFPIYTDQDLWRRYSVKKRGKRYPILATYKDIVVGEFWVELR